MGFIGVSEDRMRHILGVANQCYRIAKEKYKLDEVDCRKAYVYGYLHDIGYAFSSVPAEHPQVGCNLLEGALDVKVSVVLDHGNPEVPQCLFLKILNEADLTVDSKGKVVTVLERLEDIRARHTENSDMYRRPLKLAKKLGLIEPVPC